MSGLDILLLTLAVWALLGLVWLADRWVQRTALAAWAWWWRLTVLRDAQRSVKRAAARSAAER
jgi:hypothetical protein